MDKEESEEDRTILDPWLSRIMPCCEGSCSSGPAVREEPEGNEETTDDGRTTLCKIDAKILSSRRRIAGLL